ncbi:hypothetical protein QKC54_gp0037 [Megavirus baoshan]|uniref:Uncharacterized protein n=1 Tax=Megavirus baoshan TaxID=2496520 RepID=A0A8K1T141_9VIRU|nr:hypothetical protein QKC54_gp0037 [Megavirus baoshan]UFX99923.1 hypothetical protein Mb1035 [Megavirus baoshan]
MYKSNLLYDIEIIYNKFKSLLNIEYLIIYILLLLLMINNN